jgi:hypothetical protein
LATLSVPKQNKIKFNEEVDTIKRWLSLEGMYKVYPKSVTLDLCSVLVATSYNEEYKNNDLD